MSWRIHKLTCFVLRFTAFALTALALFLAIVPGGNVYLMTPAQFRDAGFDWEMTRNFEMGGFAVKGHGWPWVYLFRDPQMPFATSTGLPWQAPSTPWSLRTQVTCFRGLALLGDLLVAALILGAVGLGVGRWGRRRTRWRTISLRGLLLGVAVLSVGLHWFLSQQRDAVERAQLESEVNLDIDYGTPSWWWHWVGRYEWNLLDHVVAIWNAPPVDHERLTDFHSLRHVRSVEIDRQWDLYWLPPDVLLDLARLPRLERLELVCQELSNEDAAGLAQLQRLRPLTFRRSRMTDEVIVAVASLRKLDELTFDCVNLSDVDTGEVEGAILDLTPLSRLTNLRDLSLMNSQIDAGQLTFLKQLPRLEVLDLSATGIKSDALDHLVGLANLRQLTLVDTRIDDAALSQIATLRNLESLNLAGCKITDAGIAHLAQLRKLRVLRLDDTKLTDDCLAHLGTLTQLEVLSLRNVITDSGRLITDRGVRELTGLQNLRELNLNYSLISSEGLRTISTLKKLEVLNIHLLDDQGLDCLRELPHLQQLHLHGRNISDASRARLRTVLPNTWIVNARDAGAAQYYVD